MVLLAEVVSRKWSFLQCSTHNFNKPACFIVATADMMPQYEGCSSTCFPARSWLRGGRGHRGRRIARRGAQAAEGRDGRVSVGAGHPPRLSQQLSLCSPRIASRGSSVSAAFSFPLHLFFFFERSSSFRFFACTCSPSVGRSNYLVVEYGLRLLKRIILSS